LIGATSAGVAMMQARDKAFTPRGMDFLKFMEKPLKLFFYVRARPVLY
jgi:hypothetical protein